MPLIGAPRVAWSVTAVPTSAVIDAAVVDPAVCFVVTLGDTQKWSCPPAKSLRVAVVCCDERVSERKSLKHAPLAVGGFGGGMMSDASMPSSRNWLPVSDWFGAHGSPIDDVLVIPHMSEVPAPPHV